MAYEVEMMSRVRFPVLAFFLLSFIFIPLQFSCHSRLLSHRVVIASLSFCGPD